MSRFIGSLKFRALSLDELRAHKSADQLWELMEPFAFETPSLSVTVPAGFVSDFASVPRLVRWYVDDDDPAILPGSIVHDYVYGRRGMLEGRKISRAEADALLRDAMLTAGAGKTLAAVVHAAVRLGGGAHWDS